MTTLHIDHDTYVLLANSEEGFTEITNIGGEKVATLGVKNILANIDEESGEYFTQAVVYSHQRDKFYQMNFIKNNLSVTVLDKATDLKCYKLEEVVLVKREEYKFVGNKEVVKTDVLVG
tara:strand:- start:9513 stop:9869 length:357 start_codon:yes stop_codon:yes gene_type:complete